MTDRLDVRRMLLRRGWTEDTTLGALRKGGAVWAVVNHSGDGFLDCPSRRGTHVIEIPGGVPARVVVAACEAAATSGAESSAERLSGPSESPAVHGEAGEAQEGSQ